MVDEGPGAAFVNGEGLLRRPEHTVHTTLGLQAGAARLTASADFVGERADRDFSVWPAERVALPSHLMVGLGAELPVPVAGRGAPLDLLLRADNLLDEEYQEVLGFAAPGRAFYVGLRLRFGPSD